LEGRTSTTAARLTDHPSAPIARQHPTAFRAQVSGVRVDVLVTDGGRPVTGLGPEHFDVVDEGVRQQVDSAAAVQNLSVAIVRDRSWSVIDPEQVRLTRVGEAVAAALNERDFASVLEFDDRVRVVLHASHDREAVRGALQQPTRGANLSVIWDAAVSGAALAARQRGRPIVVVLSDLADNASWTTQSPAVKSPRAKREALSDWFRRAGIVLDLITVPHIWGHPAGPAYAPANDVYVGNLIGRDTGDQVAASTGGDLLRASDDSLAAYYAHKFEVLRAGYVLTFTPTGVKKGDGWHKLTVRLKGAKGRVLARPGYYSAR
jgi:VWFA-related protein